MTRTMMASIARLGAVVALLAATTLAQADFCWRQSYGRGVGTIPTDCGSKENNAGLCYNKCNAGYSGAGPVCWKGCPGGFSDNGIGCTKPGPYGRGGGYPWKFGDALNDSGMYRRCENDNGGSGKCEKWGAVVYPKCKANYHAVGCCVCSPDCPSGYTDFGVSCTKPNYTRGAGTIPTSCSGGGQYDAGLCYSQCKTAYHGVGPVCWQNCPPSTPYSCGAGCATNQSDCSGAVRDQVMSVVEVAITVATAATGAGEVKAAVKSSANAATKAAAKGITKAAAKKVLTDQAKAAGVNLTLQQIDQVAGVAAGDDWDPYSLDPTGIAAVVKAYNHSTCGNT